MSRLLVLFFVVAAACSSAATTTSTASGTASPPPTMSSPPATAPPATTATPSAPTTTQPAAGFTLDDHVDWILAVLNGDQVTRPEYRNRFDDAFLGLVPYEAFVAPLAQLAGEWSISERDVYASAASVVFERTDGLRLDGTFSREPGPAGRLDGLLLQPGGTPAPQSLDELAARWEGLAPRAALLVAGKPEPGQPYRPEIGVAIHDQLAIGSVFKLWVLHALAEAVARGDASWDEVLPVADELKSLPSGTMQDEAAGSEFTLREHAELMISISDNTATDHLIDRLGRETVEASVTAAGHAEPGLNRPFLTTRELFWLKLLAPDDVVAAYVAGDEAARRAILDGAEIDLAGADPFAITEPVEVEALEWFASVDDICRALTTLLEDFGDTPVTDVLTVNPGVQVDEDTWQQVAFKGGSEPGVLALAWHAVRADGAEFVIVGILNDPDRPVDQITAVLLAEGAFGLLADI